MVKILFGVDDVNPKKSSDGADFGGDLKNGSLGLLEDFAKNWNAKITLFLVPNYEYKKQMPFTRKTQKIISLVSKKLASKISQKGKNFSILKDSEFCSFLRKNRFFDIQMHGYTHFNQMFFQEEFRGLSTDECDSRIKKSADLFTKAGFERPVVFAPPGWYINESVINALKKNSFISVAGSIDDSEKLRTDFTSHSAGLKNVSSIYKQNVSGLINIPRNFDLEKGNFEKMVSICEKDGLISVQSHIANEGVINSITKERLEKLGKMFSKLESKGFKLEFSNFKKESALNGQP